MTRLSLGAKTLAIAHLPARIVQAAVGCPAGGLIKALALIVMREHPEHGFLIPIGTQLAERHREQRPANPAVPAGWVDRDRVELANRRSCRIAAWSNAREPSQTPVDFGDPTSDVGWAPRDRAPSATPARWSAGALRRGRRSRCSRSRQRSARCDRRPMHVLRGCGVGTAPERGVQSFASAVCAHRYARQRWHSERADAVLADRKAATEFIDRVVVVAVLLVKLLK